MKKLVAVSFTTTLVARVIVLLGYFQISRLVTCSHLNNSPLPPLASAAAAKKKVTGNRAAKLEFVSNVGQQNYRLVYETSSNLLTPSARFKMDGQVIQVSSYIVYHLYFKNGFANGFFFL